VFGHAFTFHDSGLLRDLTGLGDDRRTELDRKAAHFEVIQPPCLSSDNSSLLVTKPASCSFCR